ncbi:MAG: hypothetical protein HRT38_19940 [Alteromonadaceae bacterium]|nr:hypothetical protein [Alteromonadaceae bacterium]
MTTQPIKTRLIITGIIFLSMIMSGFPVSHNVHCVAVSVASALLPVVSIIMALPVSGFNLTVAFRPGDPPPWPKIKSSLLLLANIIGPSPRLSKYDHFQPIYRLYFWLF